MNRDDPLQRLADIVPPPAPDLRVWWLALAALMAAAALAGAIFWWRRRQRRATVEVAPREEAQRQLERLHAAWAAKSIDDRDAAYRLAALLRLGLELPQLADPPPPAAATDAATWRDTLRQLDVQRYAAKAAEPLPAAVFDHARRWLAGTAGG